MRLATLTLQGFKSFADKTTLEFTEGVTAIVGPNGSGKSNLIDALRWAAGGGRASEFRAGDKRELIFHGAANRRSLGFAEVQLGFEHAGRSLDVSRTLTSDGESKLRVGGRTARFLDLEDELSGTGLGRGGLAVIGQGEVSGVLMADPPKLLAYVAESVGVAKLSSRRESTLSALEGAQAHLVRLEDIQRALAEQVEALTAQAAEAERATALERERLQLRYTLSLRRHEGLSQEIKGTRENVARLEGALLEGREALTEAQTHRRRVRAELTEAEGRYRQFLADSAARRGDLRVAQERLRAAEAQHAVHLGEASRLGAEGKALAALVPPTPPSEDARVSEGALEGLKADIQTLQGDLQTNRAEVQARADVLEAARRLGAEAAQAEARYHSSREALSAQLEEVETGLASLPGQADDLEAVSARLGAAERVLNERRGALEEAQLTLAEVQAQHAEAYAEAQARRQAASRQRAAFEARRGYAQGPKSALTSGIDGVIGSVADLIRVPEAYTQAIGSALGRRAENIVVTSSDVAQQVLAHVRRAGGWVTLLPLDLVGARPATLTPALQSEASIVALASDVVGSDERFRPLVAQLLGSTALVSTLPDAVALAKRHRSRPRFVTLGGDVIEAYGAISGGRSQSAGLVLGAAADLEEAETVAGACEARSADLLAKLKAQQGSVHALRSELASVQEQVQEAARQVAAVREAAAAQASLRSDLERREEGLREALTNLHPPMPVDIPDVGTLTATLQNLQSAQETIRVALADAQGAEGTARSALALWQERQRTFENDQRRFVEAQARLSAVNELLERASADVQRAGLTLSDYCEAVAVAEAALPPEDGSEALRFAEAQRAEGAAEEVLEALSREQAARSGELESLNLMLARREAALELAEEEKRTFPDGLEPVPGGQRALRERLHEAESDLETLGPVNHRAKVEVEAQSTRLNDLRGQLSEAERASAELHGVLDELDQSVRVRLVAGAEALAKGFAYYAEQLFGTGAQATADLVWEEGRPSGLKLGLQPPTKTTRALSLLSVGERTMGALAFLFALMTSSTAEDDTGAATSGLPLAILDEVDAPLDEANIRRFCAFLDDLAQRGTQFVLITHQKATMETASALWGVTTEGGISRVFSIRREVEA